MKENLKNDNDADLVEKLKDFILEIEEKASKDLVSSKGLTTVQSEGFINSSAVNAILKAVDILCEGDQE